MSRRHEYTSHFMRNFEIKFNANIRLFTRLNSLAASNKLCQCNNFLRKTVNFRMRCTCAFWEAVMNKNLRKFIQNHFKIHILIASWIIRNNSHFKLNESIVFGFRFCITVLFFNSVHSEQYTKFVMWFTMSLHGNTQSWEIGREKNHS